MIAVVAILAIGLLGLAALIINDHNGTSSAKVQAGDRQTGATTPGNGAATGSRIKATTTTTTSTTTTTVPTTLGTTTTSIAPGDVRAEPPGLTCRQLSSRNYDYTAAVTYWQIQGQPGRMDVDGNGRPCETVYPPAAVRAYWHT